MVKLLLLLSWQQRLQRLQLHAVVVLVTAAVVMTAVVDLLLSWKLLNCCYGNTGFKFYSCAV